MQFEKEKIKKIEKEEIEKWTIKKNFENRKMKTKGRDKMMSKNERRKDEVKTKQESENQKERIKTKSKRKEWK